MYLIFFCRFDKICLFFELRETDMGAWRQNIETEELVAKILRYNELGEVRRGRRGIAGLPLESSDARYTFPVWTFRILGQGCSSQEREIFLWRLWKSLERADERETPTLCKTHKKTIAAGHQRPGGDCFSG
jgi:hypothetical protein